LAVIGLFLVAATSRTTAAPSADEILSQAKAAAAAEHKNIFLLFDASW
jgi:hypothetical protein